MLGLVRSVIFDFTYYIYDQHSSARLNPNPSIQEPRLYTAENLRACHVRWHSLGLTSPANCELVADFTAVASLLQSHSLSASGSFRIPLLAGKQRLGECIRR